MTLRGVCTSNRSGAAAPQTTVTLTFPGGTVVGDRISCVTGTNATSVTVTAASGANTWTSTAGPVTVVTALSAYLFDRVLDATDVATGSVTFTWSASGRVQAMGDVFTTGDTVTPFVVATATTVTGNTLTLPAYTTSTPSADIAVHIVERIAIGITAPQVVLPGTFTRDGDVGTNVASQVNTEAASGHLTTPVVPGTSVGGGSVTSGSNASHMIGWIVELQAKPVAADTGTGADALGSPSVTAPQSDTGAGADALAATVAAPIADTGSGADAVTATVTATLADARTGTDALAATATLAVADLGSGADALSASAAVPLTNAATGTDSLTATATVSLAEAPTGVDALAVAFASPLPDTGSGADALAATAAVPLTDARAGTDILAATAAVSVADLATASDALSVVVLTTLADTGTTVETFTHASLRDITVNLGPVYGRAITSSAAAGRGVTVGQPHGRAITAEPVRSDPS